MKFLMLICALLGCSKFIQSYNTKTSTPISTESIQVAALGRVADLGDLYDARRDNFVKISLYTTDLSGDAIHTTDNAHSTIDYVRTESLSEKMDKLGVSASLSVSFLGGMVSLSGSGEYLKQDKQSSKSAKTSLVYKIRTVTEDLKIFSKTSREVIDKFLLENIDATHVVVATEWGADVVLSLEETNTDSSNFQDIQGSLEAGLHLAVLSVSGSADVDLSDSDIEESSTFSLHLNGDIIPSTVPQTINESISFIRDIPKLIEKENDGKGKIMSYILMPLVTVQKVFELETNKTGIVKEIDQELIDQFMQIFQEMKDSQLLINDAYNDMSKWTLMIPESDFEGLSQLKSEFDSFTNNLKVKFSKLVVQYRNGELDEDALKDLINEYETGDWIPAKIDQLLNTYAPTMHKIRLMDLFETFNALFIDRRTDKYKILATNYQKEIRIISVDLSSDISSPYIHEIVRLFEIGASEEPEPINYYIEDASDLTIPVVNVYSEGMITSSFPVLKKEYIALIETDKREIIIMDATSYDELTTYSLPEIQLSTIAVVNDTFYTIGFITGEILSTNIDNIMKPPENGTNWNLVGSLPAEDGYVKSVAAVNGTDFYFVSPKSILYKYDTVLKTVTKISQINYANNAFVPLVTVDKVVYFYAFMNFFAYDGIELKKLPGLPETRWFPGMFNFKDEVCCIGGDEVDSIDHPVYCYNPVNNSWNITSYANEARQYPAVTNTQSGALVFGGYGEHSNKTIDTVYLDSVEVFNHNTKIWGYVTKPRSMSAGEHIAVMFYY